jgi:hypothetical protein
MNAVAIVLILAGLLIFGSCQPLIRRKIPSNNLYGIRIPAAFESEERWYEINEFGGRKFAGWSWLLTVGGVVGLFIPQQRPVVFAGLVAIVTILAVAIPLIQTCLWARKSR